jgi:hypothetical protein
MKTLAVLCNIVIFTFTGFVLATDGAPTKAAYIIFAVVLLTTPAVTVFALTRGAAGARVRRVAVALNILLLAFVCWALVDQYPHPSESGFVPYVVAVVLAPSVNLSALLRGTRARRRSEA